MTTKRRSKKIQKMRGRRAAGYGFSAGHRASGQRGGKGNAGSKKHHYLKVIAEDPQYFGKHGFKRPQKLIEELVTLNIGEIDSSADMLVEKSLAEMKGKRYKIDIAQLGIDKILGSGKVTKKMDLTGVKAITARAREKVTGVGGTIDQPEDE